MDLFTGKFKNGAIDLGFYESGTPEWHALRKEGIGGSEIGTLLGLNPWSSAVTLWAKRLGLIPDPPLTSFAVKLGNKLEQPILELFADAHPEYEIYRAGTYRHPKVSYLNANPDAIAVHKDTGEVVVIEVKTSRNYWDKIPPAYEAQVQHYLDVLGVCRGYLIGLVGMDWVEHEIAIDDFATATAHLAAQEFWKCLQEGTMPDWDGSTSTYETLRDLHPEITDEEVYIDGGHNLTLAQRKFDEADKELQKQKNQVMALMGTAKHAYVEVDGERIKIASRQSKGLGRPYLVVRK
jgi:putative phage-type endonuclease